MNNEFTNRELEVRDPNKLLIVTKEHLDKYPEKRPLLAKYYDKRTDAGLDAGINLAVKTLGAVHTPVFITTIDLDGTFVDVVIDGRQRVLAAKANGITEVPTISHSDDDKINVILEASANLARRANSPAESAYVFRKALQAGLTQEEIAAMAGVTPAAISYALTVGDMPQFIHKMIEKEQLTPTAALSLSKSFGKKAPKGSGLTKVYTSEDQEAMKTAVEALSDADKKAGGIGKVKVKQANASKAGFAEGLTGKEWDALLEDGTVPDDYNILISLFRNKISLASAQRQLKERDMSYEWLRKITPQPKPKKVKEPKVKASKKEPKVEPSQQSDSDLAALFTS